MSWGKVNLHTHTIHSDGKNTPIQMVNAYKKLGYLAVAITDHNKFTKIPKIPGIIVLEGNEHSRGEHWLEIRGEKEILRIKAHPNRYGDTCKEINHAKWDNCEVTEHSRLHPEYFRCGTPVVATDDAHSLNMVGKAWILVEYKILTKDEILRAIKEKRYALGGIL